MKRPRVRADIWVTLFLAVIWGTAFALCCRLTSEALIPGDETDSMAIKALDTSRTAVGEQLFEEADRTFHKGVGIYRRKAFTSWFSRLGQAITPEEHVHLHAESVNELVPWLYFAIRANPHYVEAYAVAAFWLAGEGGRPDLAERVLDEARANNPRDYRVYLEKGHLALKMGALTKATRAFDAANRLWERDSGSDKVQAQLDRAEMLACRGLLYEENKDIPHALTCYRDVLTIFPSRTGIRERMTELVKSGRARVAPADMWQAIIFQRQSVNEREEAEHHADHEEH